MSTVIPPRPKRQRLTAPSVAAAAIAAQGPVQTIICQFRNAQDGTLLGPSVSLPADTTREGLELLANNLKGTVRPPSSSSPLELSLRACADPEPLAARRPRTRFRSRSTSSSRRPPRRPPRTASPPRPRRACGSPSRARSTPTSCRTRSTPTSSAPRTSSSSTASPRPCSVSGRSAGAAAASTVRPPPPSVLSLRRTPR